MVAQPQLAPPGSSTYSSNTMSAGDGTWDHSRNSFLLPNLVGLNFDTMRYNGMGNRFAGMPGYHGVIMGHGIVAAFTFLLIVPSAILIGRFYHRNPVWALRMHIWLQIMTLFLSTVVFILGWFAVGPARSLTNPHHGIGLAIYVFIWIQIITGWFTHRREKGKPRHRPSIKLMLHQWLGRAIALTGIAQVGLGLTLYGAPKVLFVLYGVAVAILIVLYFVLSYQSSSRQLRAYHSSVGSRSDYVEDRPRRRHSMLNRLAGFSAAGAALAALKNRHDRRRSESRTRTDSRYGSQSPNRSRINASESHGPTASFISDEKYEDYRDRSRRHGTWRDRLLQVGAVAGAAGIAKKVFDRFRDTNSYDSASSLQGDTLPGPGRLPGPGPGPGPGSMYGPGPGPVGPPGMAPVPPPAAPRYDPAHTVSRENLSRIEEGRPPTGTTLPPSTPHHHHRRSDSFDSVSSRTSMTGHGGRWGRHNLKDGVATLGVLGVLRAAVKSRRDRKEQRRIEEIRRRDMEEERRAREGGHGSRFTGDGFPRHGGRRGSLTSTDVTGATDAAGRPVLRTDPLIPPPGPAGYEPGPGTAGALAAAATAPPPAAAALPPPGAGFRPGSSGSEAYNSPGGRRHRRHRSSRDEAAAAAGVGSAAAGGAGYPPPPALPRQTQPASTAVDESVTTLDGGEPATSPPMSVKLKVNIPNNGRNITLRRLPEHEAAERRETRRRERQARRAQETVAGHEPGSPSRRTPRRARQAAAPAGSVSSISVPEHWRRAEDIERIQAEELRREREREHLPAGANVTSTTLPSSTSALGGEGPHSPMPPPPPVPDIPAAAAGMSPAGTGSPEAASGLLAGSNYAERRQRRRAERQAAREQGRGVDYE